MIHLRLSGWWVLGAFSAEVAATQMVWLTYAPVTTVAASRWEVSVAAIGWLTQVFPLVYVVLAIPAGLALDRWFRPALLVGAALTACGALVKVFDDGFELALVGQLMVAIAQPLVLSAVTKVATGYLPARSRPLGIAIATGCTFLGMILALLLGTVFSTSDQLPTLVLIGAVFSVAAAAALLLTLGLPANWAAPASAPPTRLFNTAWHQSGVPLLAALVLLGSGCFIALTTWMEPLLAPAGVSTAGSGGILLTMIVAGFIGCLVWPPMVARRKSPAGYLQIAAGVSALGCVTLAVIPGLGIGFAAAALLGFLLLPALPIVLELTESRGLQAAGTVAAIIWLASNAGGVIITLGCQQLLDQPAAAFVLLGAVALAAVPLARRINTATVTAP